MSITLLIDGKEADFSQFVNMVATAVSDALATKTTAQIMPDFEIDSKRMYNLSDPDIKKLFGVSNIKFPVKSIIYALKKNGITPTIISKMPAKVFGYQIFEYFDKIKASQTTYLKEN